MIFVFNHQYKVKISNKTCLDKVEMHLTTLQVLHVQTQLSVKKFLGMKVTVTTTQQTLQVFVAAKTTTS